MPPRKKQTSFSERVQQVGGLPPSMLGISSDLPRVVEIDLVKLRPNPDQPRTHFDEKFIDDLAESIREKGLIQPISIARDPENADTYIIVAGEQRFRAFERLKRERIPAILTTGDPAEIAIIENVLRRDLHPLDEARSYIVLMESHGYTQEEVGKIIHKSRQTINELLTLTSLPEYIQEECRTSGIPKSTLIEIARIKDKETQRSAWDDVKSGEMTVREARKVKKASALSTKERSSKKDAVQNRAIFGANTFVKNLRELTVQQEPLDPETLERLWKSSAEIHSLLESLSSKNTHHDG